MSDAVALAVGIATAIGAVSAIVGGLLWLVKPRIVEWILSIVRPIQQTLDETHHQVSKNSHASDKPTVLDRIDDVDRNVRTFQQQLIKHLVSSESQGARIESRLELDAERLDRIEIVLTNQAKADKALWNAIEAVAKAMPPEAIEGE